MLNGEEDEFDVRDVGVLLAELAPDDWEDASNYSTATESSAPLSKLSGGARRRRRVVQNHRSTEQARRGRERPSTGG
jgi:hypothetical protein